MSTGREDASEPRSLWSAHFLDADSEDDRFDVDESGVAGDVAELDIDGRFDYGGAVQSLRVDATTMNEFVERGADTHVIVYETVVLRYRLDYDTRTATLLRLEPSPGE